ncbi:MAG TPA: peptidase M3, partial [Casimicrobiaceae bacterium]|nr:peptidase M3 [Casimicrobiaceae bacterium]
MTANPLLESWDTPDALPPFDRVRAEHFVPAFESAMAAHDAERTAIANQAEAPTFDNTVAALDNAGRALSRIELLFWNLTSSETSPALQAVELEMSPRLAAHHNATFLNAALFARIDALHRRRDELGLAAEPAKLLDRVHLDFTLAGARLAPEAKARVGAIVERLAKLSTQFSQNVLADEAAYELVLHDERDLAGLPDLVRSAAHEAAVERGKPNQWVITLSRSLIVPFLTFSDRRDLRELAFRAWTRRGENEGVHDNRPIA